VPALKQVTPVILKEIFEAADWSVYSESKWNWSMVNTEGISVEIPKRGRFVSFQAMENALAQAEMLPGDYFRYLGIVQEARRLEGQSVDGFDERPPLIN